MDRHASRCSPSWTGATPVEADLGGATRLLGYHLDHTTLKPGDTLKVTVYWLPESTTPVNETVFIQLFVPNVGVIAQGDLYPGGGTYPTTRHEKKKKKKNFFFFFFFFFFVWPV